MNKYDSNEFAIVGMNVGDDLSHIREIFELRELSWRSFHFGKNYQTLDRIGIESFPTYILLDRKQKIRSVTHQIDDRALEELLKSR